MNSAYTFLKKCGVFFLITDNNGVPAGRPFDTLIQDENDLIIGVGNSKDIYRQLKRNSRIQIVALDYETKEWIRINAFAYEEYDDHNRNRLIESSDFLKSNPKSVDELSIFKIEVLDYRVY